MTERPIIFTAHSIRRILDGTKTQTRRIVDLKKLRVRTLCRVFGLAFLAPGLVAKRDTSYHATLNPQGAVAANIKEQHLGLKLGEFDFHCPYVTGETHIADFGKRNKQWVIEPVGENRLWVKEGWTAPSAAHGKKVRKGSKVVYRADLALLDQGVCDWRSPLFMPRWASRINLIVESVRVEKLQDISDKDVHAEGVVNSRETTWYEGKPQDLFARAWDDINGQRAAWATNCWVWVIRFRRAESGIEKKA